VIESVFGKVKRLEQDQAKSGLTGLILSVAANGLHHHHRGIQKASGNRFHKTGARLVQKNPWTLCTSEEKKGLGTSQANGTKTGSIPGGGMTLFFIPQQMA